MPGPRVVSTRPDPTEKLVESFKVGASIMQFSQALRENQRQYDITNQLAQHKAFFEKAGKYIDPAVLLQIEAETLESTLNGKGFQGSKISQSIMESYKAGNLTTDHTLDLIFRAQLFPQETAQSFAADPMGQKVLSGEVTPQDYAKQSGVQQPGSTPSPAMSTAPPPAAPTPNTPGAVLNPYGYGPEQEAAELGAPQAPIPPNPPISGRIPTQNKGAYPTPTPVSPGQSSGMEKTPPFKPTSSLGVGVNVAEVGARSDVQQSMDIQILQEAFQKRDLERLAKEGVDVSAILPEYVEIAKGNPTAEGAKAYVEDKAAKVDIPEDAELVYANSHLDTNTPARRAALKALSDAVSATPGTPQATAKLGKAVDYINAGLTVKDRQDRLIQTYTNPNTRAEVWANLGGWTGKGDPTPEQVERGYKVFIDRVNATNQAHIQRIASEANVDVARLKKEGDIEIRKMEKELMETFGAKDFSTWMGMQIQLAIAQLEAKTSKENTESSNKSRERVAKIGNLDNYYAAVMNALKVTDPKDPRYGELLKEKLKLEELQSIVTGDPNTATGKFVEFVKTNPGFIGSIFGFFAGGESGYWQTNPGNPTQPTNPPPGVNRPNPNNPTTRAGGGYNYGGMQVPKE